MPQVETEINPVDGPITAGGKPEIPVDGDTRDVPRVDVEQLRLAFAYEWAPLASAAIAGVVALVVYGTVTTPVLAAWLVLSWMVAFAWDRLFRAYHRTPASQSNTAKWGRLLTIRAGINGFLWGAAAIAITGAQPVILHAFIAFVIAGMTAGALMVSASYLPAFSAFAVPATLLLAAAYVGVGDVPHFVMAAMTVLFLVLSLGIAARWNSSIRASLGLQRELVASRQRFQDFAEAAADWYYEFDSAHQNRSLDSDDRSDQAMFLRQLLNDLRSRDIADAGDADNEIFDRVNARHSFRDLNYSFDDADERRRWVRISGKPIHDREGNFQGYRGVVSDITNQKKAEEILDGERTMLEKLASDTSLPAVLNGVALWIEEAITDSRCSILLLDRETTLRRGAAPSLGETFLKSIDGVRIGSGGCSCATAAAQKELIVTEDIAVDSGWKETRELALTHGLRSCWSIPVFARTKNVLGTLAIYRATPSLPAESDLRIMRVASNLAGIAIERHRVEASQRRANRLESMGQLTAGVAHEFNNLLQAIVSGLNLLIDELPDAKKSRSRVETINRSAIQGRELIGNLLSFVGANQANTEVVAFGEVLKDTIDLLRPALGDSVDFQLKIEPDLWPVLCNRGELEAALMNLAINARDAMPDGGTIEIEAANINIDDHRVLWHGEIPVPGQYVQISIADNGTGMDPNTLDQVFDPFFTTKDVGKGTGLGMSMVYGFVRHHASGYIQIESEMDHGTSVTLYLPKTNRQVGRNRKINYHSAIDSPEGVKILVVEDDAIVRSALTTMLERIGFTIHQAGTGRDALEFMKEGLAVDLLLTDIVMTGGMNGVELSALAQKLNPPLKTLFMTGYSKEELMSDRIVREDANLLQKPFQVEELTSKIAEILHSQGSTI
ncbi:MAG: ATP-binding protein [Proteobacteria bacterium]|nr:ATP-binding protein [Pseudomonadota bacterium]